MGIGTKSMIRIESASDGTLRLDQLPELDERTLLILQAGNVNIGAFDKFEFICELANSRNAWINTDVSNYLFDAYGDLTGLELVKLLKMAYTMFMKNHGWIREIKTE